MAPWGPSECWSLQRGMSSSLPLLPYQAVLTHQQNDKTHSTRIMHCLKRLAEAYPVALLSDRQTASLEQTPLLIVFSQVQSVSGDIQPLHKRTKITCLIEIDLLLHRNRFTKITCLIEIDLLLLFSEEMDLFKVCDENEQIKICTKQMVLIP